MVDYNEMRRKFQPTKKPAKSKDSGRSAKAIRAAIQREYELKKAELQQAGAPVFRRGPLFYGMLVLLMVVIGAMVVPQIMNGTLTLGKKRIERKSLQVRKSMDALAIALGRFKFHTGEYPTDAEGLAVLAAKSYRRKGWDGPYVNHIVKDPWGNDYFYATRPEGGHPVLYSKGPNGKAGDDDDILPEQLDFEQPFRDTTWTNGWAPYRLRGIVVAPDEETKRLIQEEMKTYDQR